MLLRLYRSPNGPEHSFEECFYVELEQALTPHELDLLQWLISSPQGSAHSESNLKEAEVVEIGPRLSVETSFSSSAVAICQSMGLPVRRIEMSKRYSSIDRDKDSIVFAHLDPMTQEVYESALTTFDLGKTPEPVSLVPILEHGEKALHEANTKLGLGMDNWDIAYYTKLFLRLGRNPTTVELFQIGNANSEHSRHWFFRGEQVIDGTILNETLMDIVKKPLKANSNSLVAFHDNAGVIKGQRVSVFAPEKPGHPSALVAFPTLQHITATAETHNHPTLIAPFHGAETGTGGRIRDNRAVGRGGLVHAGLSGYSVGNLHIPCYEIPGEKIGGEVIPWHAFPLDVLIHGSNGISDYGNKIGEPQIGGFCRSFGLMIDGVRREFRKPVLYSAGLGRVLESHVKKHLPENGMLIVRIGGPAYRIGVGGGSASSMIFGAQDHGLDFKSVQRGNAEMENRVNRVIQACAEMREGNPIESIHDQGAGGVSNVLTELMDPAGGKIDIRKITVGDKTMSVLEIWVAEYQEGYGLLVRPENIAVFKSICERERVNCEVLGEVTHDGTVVVYDSFDNTTPVNLSLADILSEMPRKRFESNRPHTKHEPLVIPKELTVDDALQMVFKLPHVGSKGFLVRKVDRSVTGLVAGQQCVGPNQVPVADAFVTADGYFGLTGAATAIGEQPVKMLVNPASGARMAVAEMLTNLASVKVTKLSDVKCRANWMWAAKRPGEGALLYDAAVSLRDIMLLLGIAIDGGKDSLSMATMVGDDLVVSPGELVIMGYAPVPDITKVVTPDLKGSGCLGFVKFGGSFWRLGGSAFAQALGQIGDESPDLDPNDISCLRGAFEALQELVDKGFITAYHDVSDGGLVTAVAEMCIAGNRGIQLRFNRGIEPFSRLFSEEAGMLFEFAPEYRRTIARVMKKYGVLWNQIGTVDDSEGGNLCIVSGTKRLFERRVTELREWWERTSTMLERRQASPQTVDAESKSHGDVRVLEYKLSFTPHISKPLSLPANVVAPRKIKVLILREEGTNGDREMAAAFYTAGFEPWDVTMSDVLGGRVRTFDEYQGLIFPGGFSYADVFGSAKGWAGPIRFNPRVREMFNRFYERQDTFSLGVCNGFQLMANIGWLPWRGLSESHEPRLVTNLSGRFESRWVGVKIQKSPSIMLRGMEGSVLGMWVAHGEGRLLFPEPSVAEEIRRRELVPLVYVDPDGNATEAYPYNPNGSKEGWTALSSPDGRHLGMMPHPERCFLTWQWPWMPESFRKLEASPWLQMFQNAYTWCIER